MVVDNIEKYFRFSEIPDGIKEEATQKVALSSYRQKYHIEAPTGYLNDPNGFAFFNGQYHLFFQWSPYRYAKENIWYQGWYHLVSDNLVDWQFLGPGIEPDSKFETHGAYSGSGLAMTDELLLFYTGNTRTASGKRIPYQIIAKMNENGEIVKRQLPEVIGNVAGYTDHFRDPKIWSTENGEFLAVIGSQRNNLTGAALVFHSKDTYNWQCLGEVETGHKEFGYMWECPDYFELAGEGVLIISPQGLQQEEEQYQNIYQTGYFIGNPISKNQLTLGQNLTFTELDLGFDFYAPQTTIASDGRRILIGWMGLPELEYPTEKFGYCGTLTIPRELTIDEGQLLQKPIREIKAKRGSYTAFNKEEMASGQKVSEALELQFKISKLAQENFEIDLCGNQDFSEYTRLYYDGKRAELWLYRSQSGTVVGENYGTKRLLKKNIRGELSLQIFIDTSSIEIFIDGGTEVASSRIFPTSQQRYTRGNFDKDVSVKIASWDIQHNN